jgi:hypothetical protein
MNEFQEKEYLEVIGATKRLVWSIKTAINARQPGTSADIEETIQEYIITEIKEQIEELSSRTAMMRFNTDLYCL